MAASKSLPFFALATYQGVRQRGLKLRVAPESLPRIGRECYLRTFLKGISICLFCVSVCVCVRVHSCTRVVYLFTVSLF